MPEQRAAIPAELERSLMIEAGYRCAICKETSGLEIEHIIEWAQVREHKFENMIVLCAVCHARKTKTSDPRHINQASLKRIKSNLMMLNGRYSDLERRIIEDFQGKVATDPQGTPSIFIPERLFLLAKYLVRDGLVHSELYRSGTWNEFNDPARTVLRDDTVKLVLTPAGRDFIQNLAQA
jgi:HNH endonuclease